MKTVFITGGNSGIGKATATELAIMGYRIIFVARSREKAEAVKKEIIAISKNEEVDYILADLTSKSDVISCVETFKKSNQKLDVLINNAGVYLPERRITVDGMEESFQINHLSHFMLSNLLLDVLKKSDNPRIINVSSGAYKAGKFDPENLQGEKKYSSFNTYGNTKLLNLLFTFELAERLKDSGITVNVLHPGVVNTNFAGELKGIFRWLILLMKPFFLSPRKGAQTSVYLASSDEVKIVTGKYFEKCRPVETKNAFITRENQKILWDRSMELAGF
jgi:NAD(P)-dependent dehydrogenase (short-subunit alcohol dehydrogenase family)